MLKTCNRTFFFIILTLLSGYIIVANSVETPFMPYAHNHITTTDGAPSVPLLSLLALLNIQHDGSWQSIVVATQKEWLRKPGSERWHMEETVTAHQKEIVHLLQSMGCTVEVAPTRTHYDYVIILGATVTRVRSRLAYMIKLWNQGIRFNTIVLLGSDRPLDPAIEPESALLKAEDSIFPFDPSWQFNGVLPKTEGEMMRFVFDQMELPSGFENVTFTFVNTPMIPTAQGGMRRANTMDTIKQWLSCNPKPGTCLAVSNQPYVGYQDAVMRTGLPATFAVETVGHAPSDSEKIAVYLDTLARWIYQMQQPKS